MVTPDVEAFSATSTDDCLFPLDEELSRRLEEMFPCESPVRASVLTFLEDERGYAMIDTNGELDWHAGSLSSKQMELMLRCDVLALRGHSEVSLEGRDLYLFIRRCSIAQALALLGDVEGCVAEMGRLEEFMRRL